MIPEEPTALERVRALYLGPFFLPYADVHEIAAEAGVSVTTTRTVLTQLKNEGVVGQTWHRGRMVWFRVMNVQELGDPRGG